MCIYNVYGCVVCTRAHVSNTHTHKHTHTHIAYTQHTHTTNAYTTSNKQQSTLTPNTCVRAHSKHLLSHVTANTCSLTPSLRGALEVMTPCKHDT